jgi:hypothetical protein
MDEVIIKEDLSKKPKIKKIKFGNNKPSDMFHPMYFKNKPVYYSINVPMGSLEEITLRFKQTSDSIVEGFRENNKVYKTVYELTIYEGYNEYTLGKKVNDMPILLVFEESSKSQVTKKIDLSNFNTKSNLFFISLKRTTLSLCPLCMYYVPDTYKPGTAMAYYLDDKAKNKELTSYKFNSGLKLEVKVLTRDY